MGNQQISSFESSLWQQIQYNGVCTILKNKSSSVCVQKYYASTISQSLINLQQIFQWRCKLPTQSYVVELLQYGIKKANRCDNHDQYYAITQRVYRLGQIPKISKYEGFLAIKEILHGLRCLQHQFGLFSPDLMNIGINQQGHIRMWVNENFALNVLKEDRNGNPHRQEAVVNNLCNLISSRVYNNSMKGQYPYGYTFTKAIKSISDQITKQKDIFIPKIYRDRQIYTNYYKDKIKHQKELVNIMNQHNNQNKYLASNSIEQPLSHRQYLIQDSKDKSNQLLYKPPLIRELSLTSIPKQPPTILSQRKPYKNIKVQTHSKIGTTEKRQITVNINDNIIQLNPVNKKEPKQNKFQIQLKDDIEEVKSVLIIQEGYPQIKGKIPQMINKQRIL